MLRSIGHVMILAVVMFAVLVYVFAATASIAGATATNCPAWANELPPTDDLDIALHLRGCEQTVNGDWVEAKGFCAEVARFVTRHGFNGWRIAAKVEFVTEGRCLVWEDGDYSDGYSNPNSHL